MRKPIIIDLETQRTFREEREPAKLGISVIGVYDYVTQKGEVFTEREISRVFPILEHASYIIGFNIRSFDLPVLAPYYPGKVEEFPVFDILEDIRNIIGRRLALNDVASATLGKKKTGHGLMAIDYFKEGQWDKLKQYCLDDVMVTKELFEHGVREGKIHYVSEYGKENIVVNWTQYTLEKEQGQASLTLPFT